jgi:hypothetical protein
LLNSYPDFGQYYFGFKEMLLQTNPYAQVGKAFTSTTYPPIAMVLFSPFSITPFVMAQKVWTLLSLVSLFLSIYLIFKICKKTPVSSLGFFILGLICLSFPVKFTLGMGQINNLIFFLTVLAIFLLQKKQQIFAGVSLAVSLAVKFFPIFFPLYFILIKKWKLLFSLILTFIILNLIAFILNSKINIYFYEKVFPTLLSGWKTDYYNQSLTGFIGRSFISGIFREALKDVLSLVFVVVSFFVVFRSLKNGNLQNMHFGLLITLNLILNNFSWQHHFVFMIFPFLVTLFFITDRKLSYKNLIFLFIAYLLIASNIKNPNDFPILFRSHVFYGAVLMWALQTFIIWKDSHKLRLNSSSALKH